MKNNPIVPLVEMLSRLGVVEMAQQAQAIAALQDAGVISCKPNRTGIASSKEPRVREVLHRAFVLHCRRGDCQREADASGRPALLVDDAYCRATGHQPREHLLAEVAEALNALGCRNLLLVGGSPRYERELSKVAPPSLSLRFVDGKRKRDERAHQKHKAWADLIVIWGSTILDHAVSQHFVNGRDGWVITVPGRGIEAMLRDVLCALALRDAA